jgi:peptide/nickel transport system substrate-binding protein
VDTVRIMRKVKAISKMIIIGIVLVVVVVAGVLGYYLTMPTSPEIKDTLVLGTTDSVETCLDTARAYDFFGLAVIQSLSSGLVDYRPGATGSVDDIVPALATSWNPSADGLQWTFNLRQGVRFDDDTEFNATHVKYTIDRGISINDPDGPFGGVGYGDLIENVTVVDKYTVRFYLKIPFSAFLSLMAFQASFIVDPKYAPSDSVVEYNASRTPRENHAMGLGPYKLANWTRVAGRETEIRLEANPKYWNASAGLPKTSNIIIRFYRDSAGLALAINSGQVDVAFRQLAATDINNMKTNTNLRVWEGTGAFIQYLCFQERYAPFNATAIRQAVGAAINRTTIVQTVFLSQAQKLYTMIPIGMFGHTDAFLNLGDPNYTKTRELLAPLGYNENNKLTFKLWYETSGHYPQSAELVQVLKSSIEASGVITVNLDGLDWSSYKQKRRNAEMEAYIYGWYPDYVDPDDYIYPFVHSIGGGWLNTHYSNPQMDTLIEWARGNTSAATRNSLYEQIQNLMVTDAPIVPIYQGSAYAVSNLKVKGIYLDITQVWRHWLVYIEE